MNQEGPVTPPLNSSGYGFGYGSVAVLVTIRNVSQSHMSLPDTRKCCATSTGLYHVILVEQLQ
jgi:hypothetical protein